MRKKFMSVFSSVLLVVIAVSGVCAAELPVSYDLREHNVVPSKIRDQGGFGLCWAFAALGSIESNYMMSVSESTDFAISSLNDTSADNPHTSELHLGWFTRKAETGQEYRVFSVVSGDRLLSMKELEANPVRIVKGASWGVPAAFLSRGFGYSPVLYSDLPYPDTTDDNTLKSMMSDGTLAKKPTDSKYHSPLLVTNVDSLKYPTDYNASDFSTRRDEIIREVKGIIMDRGAMSISYTDVDGSRNETYKTYYCSEADIGKIEST
ncbi:MAG: hypothetical protein IJM47_01155, partial [Synergistaceae bacterium]|nr:hypothetical protein [Synergistaceae bacterium]